VRVRISSPDQKSVTLRISKGSFKSPWHRARNSSASLRPQSGAKGSRLWTGAFAVVGILSAAAIFNELRGTDQILSQIWDHLKESKPSTPDKEGARFVLSAGAITKEAKTVEINAFNKGDLIVRVGGVRR
jgi:hypothetical protein